MPVALDHDRASMKSRLVAIRTAQLTLRLMENWRGRVKEYDSVMILLAVVVITAEKLTREDLAPKLKDLSGALPDEKLGHCNVNSIAAATGLNRETVRRKVQKLVEEAYLVRSGGGLRYNPLLENEPKRVEMVWMQLETVRKATNELLCDGALSLRP